MKHKTRFESPWTSGAKLSLFSTPSEARLYGQLRTRYKGRMIAPQVSFSALFPRGQMKSLVIKVLDTRCPKRIRKVMEYLSKSRVDFVVFNHRGVVEAVVESNGNSHRNGTLGS